MVANEYFVEGNKHLLFILPGQSMTSRAFWDFKLPDGKTHTEYFVEAGIDVVLFDPAGYGDSEEYFNYDRIEYSNQIEYALSQITKQYESKTIFGFSTSTAPALVAANRSLFDKVIIHSPAIRNDKKFYKQHDEHFETGFKKLKEERVAKISDTLIPKSNKLEGWENAVKEVMGCEHWKVPAQVVYDINNYFIDNGEHGFDPEKVPPMLAILGEYDYEATTGGYDEFKKLFPRCKESIIPNSTHFSMWENACALTRLEIIQFVVSLQLK